MITSFILRAIVIKGTDTLSFSGFITRGIVYNILKSISPSLAEETHKMKKISPLSTSPLTAEPNRRTINTGSIVTFRISILNEELAIKLRDYILENIDLTLKIGNTEARLADLSILILDPKKMLEEAKPVKSFSVSFLSPTFFRQSLAKKCCQYCPNLKIKCPNLKQYKHYRYIPLPDPYLMFRNLLRLWRKYTGISLNHKEYIEWLLKGGIAVAGYRKLKTVRVYEHPTTPKWSVGFIGEVMFNLPEDTYNEEMAKTTHTLLKFGEHSNIGGNRTAGFGAIKYQPKQET